MTCVKCGSQNLLVESVDDKRSRRVCQECGFSSIHDDRGCRLFTDDMPVDNRRVLVE